jgi:hypothetical protein
MSLTVRSDTTRHHPYGVSYVATVVAKPIAGSPMIAHNYKSAHGDPINTTGRLTPRPSPSKVDRAKRRPDSDASMDPWKVAFQGYPIARSMARTPRGTQVADTPLSLPWHRLRLFW